MAEVVGDVWEPSSAKFWLGTDGIGRDLLTRMIYGGQTTIAIATAATHAELRHRRHPRASPPR